MSHFDIVPIGSLVKIINPSDQVPVSMEFKEKLKLEDRFLHNPGWVPCTPGEVFRIFAVRSPDVDIIYALENSFSKTDPHYKQLIVNKDAFEVLLPGTVSIKITEDNKYVLHNYITQLGLFQPPHILDAESLGMYVSFMYSDVAKMMFYQNMSIGAHSCYIITDQQFVNYIYPGFTGTFPKFVDEEATAPLLKENDVWCLKILDENKAEIDKWRAEHDMPTVGSCPYIFDMYSSSIKSYGIRSLKPIGVELTYNQFVDLIMRPDYVPLEPDEDWMIEVTEDNYDVLRPFWEIHCKNYKKYSDGLDIGHKLLSRHPKDDSCYSMNGQKMEFIKRDEKDYRNYRILTIEEFKELILK